MSSSADPDRFFLFFSVPLASSLSFTLGQRFGINTPPAHELCMLPRALSTALTTPTSTRLLRSKYPSPLSRFLLQFDGWLMFRWPRTDLAQTTKTQCSADDEKRSREFFHSHSRLLSFLTLFPRQRDPPYPTRGLLRDQRIYFRPSGKII